MHTVETLEHALNAAARLGYEIRHDWLGGSGGGGCVLRGRKLLLVDLALGTAEQLDQVLDALRHDADTSKLPMPQALCDLLTSGTLEPQLLHPR
jgi:hypothetical protein